MWAAACRRVWVWRRGVRVVGGVVWCGAAVGAAGVASRGGCGHPRRKRRLASDWSMVSRRSRCSAFESKLAYVHAASCQNTSTLPSAARNVQATSSFNDLLSLVTCVYYILFGVFHIHCITHSRIHSYTECVYPMVYVSVYAGRPPARTPASHT